MLQNLGQSSSVTRTCWEGRWADSQHRQGEDPGKNTPGSSAHLIKSSLCGWYHGKSSDISPTYRLLYHSTVSLFPLCLGGVHLFLVLTSTVTIPQDTPWPWSLSLSPFSPSHDHKKFFRIAKEAPNTSFLGLKHFYRSPSLYPANYTSCEPSLTHHFSANGPRLLGQHRCPQEVFPHNLWCQINNIHDTISITWWMCPLS